MGEGPDARGDVLDAHAFPENDSPESADVSDDEVDAFSHGQAEGFLGTDTRGSITDVAGIPRRRKRTDLALASSRSPPPSDAGRPAARWGTAHSPAPSVSCRAPGRLSCPPQPLSHRNSGKTTRSGNPARNPNPKVIGPCSWRWSGSTIPFRISTDR